MGFWCEIGFRSGHQAERTPFSSRLPRSHGDLWFPVASFAPFSRTRTHLARDLLTRAPLCTPLLAAFAPLPTPLHTARLGLSL